MHGCKAVAEQRDGTAVHAACRNIFDGGFQRAGADIAAICAGNAACLQEIKRQKTVVGANVRKRIAAWDKRRHGQQPF